VLARWFTELWAIAEPADGDDGGVDRDVTEIATTAAPARATVTAAAATGASAVRILRTTPDAPRLPGSGRTEILDAYLEAIARATEYVYLESQYFSARPIAQAVRSALDARPELELILVLNQNPDVTGYRAWQDARLAEHGLLAHPRVGVFALWSVVPSRIAPGRVEVTQVFVHSKVAVIDDAWATLGTANLDGASLHSYGDDFVRWPGRRAFDGYRNYDLNVALLDGVGGEARTGVAGTLRRRLWARHLGVPEQDLHTRPADGWLPLWRARAAENVARIAAAAAPPPRGRALPYVPLAHPRAQLRALGIDPDASGLQLRFDPGPLEVRYNLGWIEKTLPEWVRRWL
jgi:phosphatidylserine/phosphatidylglycerophosphate/cardiolipin synthase-like enzyme